MKSLCVCTASLTTIKEKVLTTLNFLEKHLSKCAHSLWSLPFSLQPQTSPDINMCLSASVTGWKGGSKRFWSDEIIILPSIKLFMRRRILSGDNFATFTLLWENERWAAISQKLPMQSITKYYCCNITSKDLLWYHQVKTLFDPVFHNYKQVNRLLIFPSTKEKIVQVLLR